AEASIIKPPVKPGELFFVERIRLGFAAKHLLVELASPFLAALPPALVDGLPKVQVIGVEESEIFLNVTSRQDLLVERLQDHGSRLAAPVNRVAQREDATAFLNQS